MCRPVGHAALHWIPSDFTFLSFPCSNCLGEDWYRDRTMRLCLCPGCRLWEQQTICQGRHCRSQLVKRTRSLRSSKVSSLLMTNYCLRMELELSYWHRRVPLRRPYCSNVITFKYVCAISPPIHCTENDAECVRRRHTRNYSKFNITNCHCR